MEKLKCIVLKGEFEDFGKHVMMPFGITLCGMPTVDCDITKFPALQHKEMADMISDYKEVEWDITCEKCITVLEIIERGEKAKRAVNN